MVTHVSDFNHILKIDSP